MTRTCILLLALSACSPLNPDSTPGGPDGGTPIDAVALGSPDCPDIAEAFCEAVMVCWPNFPIAWCIEEELASCQTWRVQDECLEDVEALELDCEEDAHTVPCSCNPGQDHC